MGAKGAIGTCRVWLSLVRVESEKIAQFYSVLLSFGLVRTAEWIERRIEQKTAVKKIMVQLGAVGSRWVPLGAERFGSSLRISELLSQ